jgi:hypothetical protein
MRPPYLSNSAHVDSGTRRVVGETTTHPGSPSVRVSDFFKADKLSPPPFLFCREYPGIHKHRRCRVLATLRVNLPPVFFQVCQLDRSTVVLSFTSKLRSTQDVCENVYTVSLNIPLLSLRGSREWALSGLLHVFDWDYPNFKSHELQYTSRI